MSVNGEGRAAVGAQRTFDDDVAAPAPPRAAEQRNGGDVSASVPTHTPQAPPVSPPPPPEQAPTDAARSTTDYPPSAPVGQAHPAARPRRNGKLEFLGPLIRLVQFVYEFFLHSVAAIFVVIVINIAERVFDLFHNFTDVTWQVDTAHQFTARDVLHWYDLGIFSMFALAGVLNGIRILGGKE